MAERPIIFSAPMVRALLTGSKTMARRLLKPQPEPLALPDGTLAEVTAAQVDGEPCPRIALGRVLTKQKVRFAVGDHLWVRENLGIVSEGIEYCADSGLVHDLVGRRGERHSERDLAAIDFWNHYAHEDGPDTHPTIVPSIFCPRWASRITLAVTAVKVERLQDMRGDDAIAEGIDPAPHRCGCERCSMTSELCPATSSSLVMAFGELWDSLHGPGAWESNPWVICISFNATQSENMADMVQKGRHRWRPKAAAYS